MTFDRGVFRAAFAALALSCAVTVQAQGYPAGTILHLAGETLKSLGGIRMIHIPYKGSSQAVAGLLGGEVAVSFSTTPPAVPHIQAGKLRALGVSSAQRSPLLPDVPTVSETLKGFDIVLYNGIMGPAGFRAMS